MADRTKLQRWFTRSIAQPVEGAIALTTFRVLGAMSVDRASAIGGWVGRNFGPWIGVTRRARRNLERAFPEKSPAELNAIVTEMWDNLGRVAAEYPHLSRLEPFRKDGRFEIRGLEHIDAAVARRQPIILFAAHLANWEVCGVVAIHYGIPLHLIYRPANNPWVERLFRKGRGDISRSLIQKGAAGARAAIATLEKGEPLGILVDQKMNDGIPVPFFGRDAMTAPAIAQLALRFHCTVLPTQVERLGGTRFRLTVHPPLELPRSGNRLADIKAIMTRVNAVVEEWIRQRPGQWLWVHRRWSD
ncbi:MAG TPA: lauroyl acyltransferase [Alphaproteobacteria bacterium]|nr:lauroyl acyltransferase [Alphaproteobacteria bacterium]